MAARATLAAVQQCGFHDGTVSLLQGRGADVGLGMVRHPAARACGFTGSLGGGRALFDAASSRPVPIPVFAEMGSTNPICILPGKLAADPAAQAAALFGPVTGGAGQFCTKPGIILLEEGAAAETFIDAFAKLVLDHAGDVMLNRGIASSYQGGIARLGATDGVTPVALAMPADGAPAVCGCAAAFRTSAATFAADAELREELFGPWTLFVLHESAADFEATIRLLPGQLTASLHGTEEELASAAKLWDALGQRAGRLIANGYPTGVEVCNAMQHGGPYPATTDGRFTSVGGPAIRRWVRPVAFQNAPEALLPPQLHNANPMGIWRLVNNSWSKEAIG
ncbi:MAG: aldehyde dehydrogenase family protein [Verrucomicrobiales bacterium]